MDRPEGRRPWHALLAPIPPEVRSTRKPLVPPDVLRQVQASAIAGWTNVTVELSDPGHGLRHLLVTVDETGRPLSASDHVLYRLPGAAPGKYDTHQESIGGRIEADGSFRGTCWLVTGPEPEADAEPEWDMRSRPPADHEIVALKALVADMLGRVEP